MPTLTRKKSVLSCLACLIYLFIILPLSSRLLSGCWKNAILLLVLQGSTSVPIFVPLSSSDHHVELNMRSQSKNARYALTALANGMSDKHQNTETAVKNFKVIVLYEVDKVSEMNQRLIKWMIDSSFDACKIIMTCQDESNLLDTIMSRCKLISISVLSTREDKRLPVGASALLKLEELLLSS